MHERDGNRSFTYHRGDALRSRSCAVSRKFPDDFTGVSFQAGTGLLRRFLYSFAPALRSSLIILGRLYLVASLLS
jgi:hypothetical protein